MENYYWTTEQPHSSNEVTMHDFIDNHCELDIEEHDGTIATGRDENGILWRIYASGNGDFCNHMVRFEQLEDQNTPIVDEYGTMTCNCEEPQQRRFPNGKWICLKCWGEWYH